MRVLLIALFLMFASQVFAEAKWELRCDLGVVQRGDSKETVENKCGAPANISKKSQQVINSQNCLNSNCLIDAIDVETWTYRWFGRFRTDVYFENGKLAYIFEDLSERIK